jgi:predicted nucleotidyltransferase
MNSILTDNLEAIQAVCRARQVDKLYALGAAVRGDMNDESDIDLRYSFDINLVMESRRKGFDYINNLLGLEADLKKILRRPIDLVPDGVAHNPIMRAEITATKKLLYAAAA